MKLKLITLLFLAFSICSHAQTVLQGPDAPAAAFTYSSGIFEMTLDNPSTSNNFNEMYLELDTAIDSTAPSQLMAFQGYIIYQLAHDSVLPNQLDDISLARIVGQSDIQDNIIDCYSTLYDQATQTCFLTLAASGNNTGVQHVYNLDTDVFTGGSFVDGQTYCFLTVAYAVNPWRTHPICPNSPDVFIRSVRGPTGGGLLSYCVTADVNVGNGQVSSDAFLTRIFPNPAANAVNVQFVGAETAQLKCFDSVGNLLLDQRIAPNEQINLDGFSAGIYFLEIAAEGESPVTQKLIIR